MMHHEAGVPTVVVGGRPNIGLMQAVAGTRGTLSYNACSLDSDMFTAIVMNQTVTSALLRSHVASNLEFYVTISVFNLKDQIRKNEYFPLQS